MTPPAATQPAAVCGFSVRNLLHVTVNFQVATAFLKNLRTSASAIHLTRTSNDKQPLRVYFMALLIYKLIRMTYICNVQSKGKDRNLPRKAQRRSRGIALISLTSVLDGGGANATPRPLNPRERDTAPIVQEAAWRAGPVWTGQENLASTGNRSLDRTSRSESLHQLSYPGACTFTVMV